MELLRTLPARHDLVVDWAVKPQHKQTKLRTLVVLTVIGLRAGECMFRPNIYDEQFPTHDYQFNQLLPMAI